MSSTSRTVPRHVETRAKNKSTHPGDVSKPNARRTSAEVQQERAAKAKAKLDREEAKRQSITRTAEFERGDMANEDSVDATPRPPFTPKPWPPTRGHKTTKLFPVSESNDDEDAAPDPAGELPVAGPADDSESNTESDSPPPPPKKQKVHRDKARGVSMKKLEAEKKKLDKNEEVMTVTDDDGQETPRPKKMRMRDEINFAAQKIDEDKAEGNKYGGMVESVFGDKQAAPSDGMPASEALSQHQAAGKGKKLKREGAIADINALYKKATPANPGMPVSTKHQNQVMNIDIRFLILPYSHVTVTDP
jgi:hypothetical protein